MTTSIIPSAISSQLDHTGSERIHIANTVPGGVVRTPWIAPPNPFESVFLSWAGNSLLYYGTDENQTTFMTVDAGGFISAAETRVHACNGFLFTTRQSGRTRVSSDGLTWGAVSGLSQSGTIKTMIHNGTQFIAYTDTGSSCWVSPDAVNWTSQALGFTVGDGNFAKKGSSVLGFQVSTTNTIRLSVDNGATFSSVSMGGAVTSFSKTFPLATANRFLVFGSNTASPFQALVKWSATGGVGTWTEVTLPLGGFAGGNTVRTAAYDSVNNRVLAILLDGSVMYSDDEGSTWSVGTAVVQATQAGDLHYSAMNEKFYYLSYTATNSELHSSPNGVTAWALNFSLPLSSNGLNNLALWELV